MKRIVAPAVVNNQEKNIVLSAPNLVAKVLTPEVISALKSTAIVGLCKAVTQNDMEIK